MRFVLLLLLFTTPQEYFQLGIARHDAGDYAAAREAFEKARELKHPAPILLPLRLARTYARLGERDKAFESLKTAIDRGYPQVEQLFAENDFLPLREDPRWSELVTAARRNQHPCRNAPEYRQFDFWLGEWDVEANGQKIARSSIQLILDECVIFENYEQGGGYSGKSLTAWDAGEQRWEQHYTDTGGSSRYWLGRFEDGRLVMHTEFEQQGATVRNRMTYSKEGPDRVRQLIETSLDGGKTWAASYDGMYVRRR